MDLSTANIPPGLTIIPTIAPTPRATPLSNSNSNSTNNNNNSNGASNETETRYSSRRVLRPRTEPRSYAEIESPDINTLNGGNGGADKTEKVVNGDYDSDEEDAPMPEVEFKELSAAEIWERERKLRKLREELRNEETKLVLLKKIKHSQHVMKENKTPNPVAHNLQQQNYNNPLALLPPSLSKGSLTVIPTNLADYKGSSSRNSSINDQAQCFPLPRQSLPGGATLSTGTSSRAPFIQGKVLEGRSSNLSITPSVTITPTTGPVMNLKTKNQSPMNLNNSVSITPTASISISQNNSVRNSSSNNVVVEDTQTQAQKQAAAKLALRKQLEKTLLQIPPPKPPPPEMHFIPNPSNGEFVYLLGLEHVVDYLTKEKKTTPTPQQPFKCAQCKIDFTPVWKMERDKRAGADAVPKIICESCVTSNVKKALKAEHTNRLKTAFVKALQQEQEIEQRMAAQSSSSASSTPTGAADFSMHSPAQNNNSGVTIQPQSTASISLSPAPSKQTRIVETPTPRPTPTPPNQPTPPPQSSSRNSSSSRHQSSSSSAAAAAAAAAAMDPMSSMAFVQQLNALASLGNFGSLGGNMGNFSNSSQNAAAMQAFQQQLFRGIQNMSSGNQQANLAAQMQFGPLLYSYQLAMAQAQQQAQQQQQQQAAPKVNKTKTSKTPTSNNVAMDMQRAMEMQRQYLEMLTQANQLQNQGRGGHNWKNN